MGWGPGLASTGPGHSRAINLGVWSPWPLSWWFLPHDAESESPVTTSVAGMRGLCPHLCPQRVQVSGFWAPLTTTEGHVPLSSSRSFAELLELSAEASKEVALANQEAWEETLSTEEAQRCYFRGPGGTTASKIPSAP